MSQIVVVNSDSSLTNVVNLLNAAGYHASGASTYEEAKWALAQGAPDLIIADERLGAYNGLHVIMRARAEYPDVSAIVMTPVKNRGLEADAKSLNVECLIKPQSPAEWLRPILKALNSDRAARHASARREAFSAAGGL
jgi:DNA-binding NtrC family response regulator